MKSKLKYQRKVFFALPLKEANFSKRGFLQENETTKRLELVAKVVVHGYNVAIEEGLSENLLIHDSMIDYELKGFFNEGLGMGLYTLDLFSLRSNYLFDFTKDYGKNHEYMSYIGAGIASGVFKKHNISSFLEKANPTCGLLILNGIGFYYAYFKPTKTLNSPFYIPKEYLKDTFYTYCYDNGVGRSLWFYTSGSPKEINTVIDRFPENRRAGIWAGVGLAATYANGTTENVLEELKNLSSPYEIHLGEGSVLAVHTRDLARNFHPNQLACEILTHKSASEIKDFSREAILKLENNRYINNQHSLEYFFDNIRNWLKN